MTRRLEGFTASRGAGRCGLHVARDVLPLHDALVHADPLLQRDTTRLTRLMHPANMSVLVSSRTARNHQVATRAHNDVGACDTR